MQIKMLILLNLYLNRYRTIASGVAKAFADKIVASVVMTVVASPKSIQHAGLPWELGLAETSNIKVK